MKHLTPFLLAALLLILAAPYAEATMLTPGGCIGTSASCGPALTIFSDSAASLTLLAETSQNVTPVGAAWSGTLHAAVYLNAITGGLDFYYQFINAVTSTDSVDRLTAYNFAGWTTDIGYRTTAIGSFVAGTEIPIEVDREADGSTVGFDFFTSSVGNQTGMIGPGEASRILVIRTTATAFTTGTFSAIDGTSATILAYQPIPEPATMSLLGSGFAGLALLLRRRNRR